MYQFKFESIHGVTYTVRIGAGSGTITRPLGKAPVIRMKEGDVFRATSCDLVLQCNVDGEFSTLYTSNPHDYSVEVLRGLTTIWKGYVATELYSEPNIAPPYDVAVTATDGLGTLKEYAFNASGKMSLKDHVGSLLALTGLNLDIDWVTSLRASDGSVVSFIDDCVIDLDYLAGKNCYDVLKVILESIHATITQYQGHWLIIRETDLSFSGGSLSVYRSDRRIGYSTRSASVSNACRSVGKMGVADMWPVGYTTRRAVPAKRRVTVEAPWHLANAAPSIQDEEWTIVTIDEYTGFVDVSAGKSYYYLFSHNTPSVISMRMNIYTFVKSFSVKIKASAIDNPTTGNIGIYAKYSRENLPDNYFYNEEDGWKLSNDITKVGYKSINKKADNVDDAQEVEFIIPARDLYAGEYLSIYLCGYFVTVFDVQVRPIFNAGFKDVLSIDNGARGEAGTVEIAGGRMDDDFDIYDNIQGIWESDQNTHSPIYLFTDGNFSGKDWVSLQALGRALSVALPRIETSGVLDFPSGITYPPIGIRANSAYSLVTSFEWNLKEEEFSFKAITLPAGSITVESETVTSLGNGGSSGSSSSGGSGGGGSAPAGGYEQKSNKVTSISAQSTNEQYPSAKLLYDTVGNIETLLAAL